MTRRWPTFLQARRGTDQRLIPSGRAASELVGRTAVPCPGDSSPVLRDQRQGTRLGGLTVNAGVSAGLETSADGSTTPSVSASAHTRRQTDPQAGTPQHCQVTPGLRLVPDHGAVSDPAAEPTYPDTPLASRRAPTVDEIAQMRLDVLDGYATLGRVLSTPAINPDAEARRQWAIDICTSEIARMERNLLELRRA